MKAMILAAGLGTRLRPLTNDRPKALVKLGERTLLEITLNKLRDFGIRDVIINVHHFAEMVIDYLRANHCFRMRIEISREDVLLDTGGGLKKAAWFFLENAKEASEPFLLHNVDVISNIDFARLVRYHTQHQALATLVVQQRKTSRYLLFDEELQLCGRRPAQGQAEIVRHSNKVEELAFSGIHLISTSFLRLINESGAFSIIDSYLQASQEGHKVLAFRADDYYWRDLGTPHSLKQAEKDYKSLPESPDPRQASQETRTSMRRA